MRKFMLLALLLTVFTVQPAVAESLMGQKSFTVASKKNVLDTIKAAKGKVLVLNFFASWCPPCREEIPDLVKLRKQVGDDKLLILGISVDENLPALTKMNKSFGFNYPVFLAGSGVASHFDVESIPLNIVFAPNGDVAYNDVGILDCDSVRDFVQNEAFK